MEHTIHIYTDGAASGNPGPGGYGIIIQYVGPEKPGIPKGYFREYSDGFRHTTNNRMELLAVIVALEKLQTRQNVLVVSDSKYVIDSVCKGWVFNWNKKADFAGKKNIDLWKRFLEVYPKHDIEFKWVKGHNSHIQNERCDKLAVMASKASSLKIDVEYEKSK